MLEQAIVFIFSFCILIYSAKIGKFFNLVDIPNKRKLNSKSSVKIGSLIFLLPILFFLINSFYLSIFLNLEIICFFVIFTLLFFIGFVDDSKGMLAIKKIILYFFISFLFLKINPRFMIHDISLYSFNIKNISIISIYFTCFCIVCVIVASDLLDGINISASFFFFINFLFIIFVNNSTKFFDLNLSILIVLFLFFIFNIKNKVYLGTGGTCILAFILSLNLIEVGASNPKVLSATHIFSLLFLPGVDMIRVFLVRLFSKGGLFIPDQNHIHHIIVKEFGINKAIIFLCLFYLLTNLSVIIFYNKIYYIILAQLVVYFTCILKNYLKIQ